MTRKTEERVTALVTSEIEALADAVLGDVEPEGVERALAAFRETGSAAEGAGPRGRRRRDDWRPARRRLPTPASASLRAALGVVLAGVAFGGVALAVGTGVLPDPFGPDDGRVENPGPRPGVEAPRTPGASGTVTGGSTPSPAPKPSASSHHLAPNNQVALCHAWSNGKHQGAAFRRLTEAAGGESAVAAYCAALPSEEGNAPSTPGKPVRTAAPGQSTNRPAASPARGRSAEHSPGAGKHR